MSRFYASIDGGRSERTVTGHARAGIRAHPRGWNTGVLVDGGAVGHGDGDRFTVSVTGGSNDGRRTVELAEIREVGSAGGAVLLELGPSFGSAAYIIGSDGTVSALEPSKEGAER